MLLTILDQVNVGKIKHKMILPARRRLSKLKLKSFLLALVLIDKVFGARAGNAIFWAVGDTFGWSIVEARISWLYDSDPKAIADFAKRGFSKAKNFEVLVSLARSKLTKDTIRDCLLVETLDEKSSVRHRMIKSQMTCAGFIAAAALLLSDKQSIDFANKTAAFSPPFSNLFRRAIDSCGMPIVGNRNIDACRNLINSGFKSSKKHRLLIVDSLENVTTLPLLFQGAETASVFVMDDLYGRVDFEKQMHHSGSCHVNVEHCRSRITRFSSDYHHVHEDTRAVAESMTSILADKWANDFPVKDQAGIGMALADNIFFPCLQFAALEKLFASSEFDHIVIAINGSQFVDYKKQKKFIYYLSGIKDLATDTRVETVCLSPSSRTLKTLDALNRILCTGMVPAKVADQKPLIPAVDAFKSATHLLAQKFKNWPNTEQPRVLMATTEVAAYNKSSVAYSETLSEISNFRLAFLSGNPLSFLESGGGNIKSVMVLNFTQKPNNNFKLLHEWLIQFIADQLGNTSPDYIAHVLSVNLSDVARNGLLAYLAHTQLCEDWFARLDAMGQLPQALVMTPFRSIRVSAFAAVARQYNIPSLAIEPHGLNASYCRYCKITADYYGVISQFFAQAAAEGFGIPIDRCPVIGSPRLLGPKDYDVHRATAAAREQLRADNQITLDKEARVISYFTQPSDWAQISQVWRIILKATANLNCQLVLKTHPEEAPSRVNAYLSIAEKMGAMDRVQLFNADPISLIEASDLVLSGYSATVVEATLYSRPVFCVTNGKVDYPLNQHDVINGMLFRTASKLRREIKAFLKDPTPYRSAAAEFLLTEKQLVDGFEVHLQSFVNQLVSMPIEQTIRHAEELPQSLFLDGPHSVYEI